MSLDPLRGFGSGGALPRSSISMHVEDLDDQHEEDIERAHELRAIKANGTSSSSSTTPVPHDNSSNLPAPPGSTPSRTPPFAPTAVVNEPLFGGSNGLSLASSGAFPELAREENGDRSVRVEVTAATPRSKSAKMGKTPKASATRTPSPAPVEEDPFNFVANRQQQQNSAPPSEDTHLPAFNKSSDDTSNGLTNIPQTLINPPSAPPSPSNTHLNVRLGDHDRTNSLSLTGAPHDDSQVVRFSMDDPFVFDAAPAADKKDKEKEKERDKKEVASAKNVNIEMTDEKTKSNNKNITEHKALPLPLTSQSTAAQSTSAAGGSGKAASSSSKAAGFGSDGNWLDIYLNYPARNADRFPSNVIQTSKYTVFTFLFINLFEQFRRVANSYFLLIVILQLSANVSPFPIYTNVAPLVIILAVGMLNAIREDYYRHKSDRIANSRPCRRIENGKVIHCQSKDIQTGQILEIHQGEEFPADLVLFASSHADAVAYVNTANLDGEAAPKVRYAPQATMNYTSAQSLSLLKGKIKCEKPSAALYYFKGQLFLKDQLEADHPILIRAQSQLQPSAIQHQNSTHKEKKSKEPERERKRLPLWMRVIRKKQKNALEEAAGEYEDARVFAVSDKQLLLRGAKLVNTERVWGLVAYTGADTKLMLNRNPAKFKFSEFERVMNQFVFVCLGINLAVCFTVAIFFQYSSQSWADVYDIGSHTALSGFLDFLTQYILFSFMIPLSLYVTIELVKVCQAQFMEWDNQMAYYDPDTRTTGRCVVKSSALNEELGVVDCICSDKTGTLTQNKMELSRCAVGGRLWFTKAEQIAPVNAALPQPQIQHQYASNSSAHERSVSKKGFGPVDKDNATVNEFMKKWKPLLMRDMALLAFEDMMLEEEKKRMYEKETALDSEKRAMQEEGHFQFYAQMYKQFMLCILLCNAALPAGKDEKDREREKETAEENAEKKKAADAEENHANNKDHTDEKEEDQAEYSQTALTIPLSAAQNPTVAERRKKMIFESQSPDEIALLESLHQLGVTLYQKQATKVVVEIFTEYMSDPIYLQYDLKAILEFSSSWRRMSVVAVEQKTNAAWIFTKGADTTIEQMVLKKTELQNALLDSLKIHATDFAATGSRTLVFAGRQLSGEECAAFYPAYQEAETSLDDRDMLIEQLFRKSVETDLHLLGCSAVEDQLQEFVPEAVDFLVAAKVKIIVVTGDKMETAVTIGKQCHLVQPSARLFYMGGLTKEEVEKNIKQILTLIQAETEQWEVRSRSHFIDTETESPPVFAAAIDGVALELCVHHWKMQLVGLLSACSTVICYRSTPKQKALTVRLVKEQLGLHCLAIGDGANDVSMILESHVGVGILGKEGAHAAMSADFVIRRFHHLRRLLAIHGRYNFFRTAQVVFFCFYKNFAMPLPLFWYQFWCAGTGTLAYDSLLLSCFNTFFTSVPPFFAGIFDKDVQERTLMAVPQSFAAFRWQGFFNMRSYFEAIITAVWHSVVVFFSAYLLWSENQVGRGGVSLDLYYMGNSMMTSVVIITSVYMMVSSEYINMLTVFGILFGWAWYVGVFIFVNNTWEPSLSSATYGVATQMFLDSVPYLYFFITVIVALMPWIMYKTFKRELHPTFYQRLQKLDQLTDEQWETAEKKSVHEMNELLYQFPQMHVKAVASMNPTEADAIKKSASAAAIAVQPNEQKTGTAAGSAPAAASSSSAASPPAASSKKSGAKKLSTAKKTGTPKEKVKGITIKVNEHDRGGGVGSATAKKTGSGVGGVASAGSTSALMESVSVELAAIGSPNGAASRRGENEKKSARQQAQAAQQSQDEEEQQIDFTDAVEVAL